MSGHSKWAKIHRQKGAADQKRGKVFSKLVRNIIVAAKDGSDPEMNFKLKLAIDKAKAENMPKDNIDRAVAKGAGGGDGVQMEEILYEGIGPGGSALLIEVATDNRNRTTSDIKSILNKVGGTLGGPNSVQWMFDHKGIIRVNKDQYEDRDAFQLEVIDLGAEDVDEEEGGLTIYCSFENFPKIQKALTQKGLELEYAQVEWIAKDELEMDGNNHEKLEKLAELFDDYDDITNYYTNAK